MTPEQQKEEISKAYVHAVAAACGYTVGSWSQDAQCIDVTLAAPGAVGLGTLEDPQVNLQLKCTSSPNAIKADHIAWQLEKARYDRLRARAQVPKLLVVLELHQDESQWFEHTVEHLLIRRCAYWLTMTGMPAIEDQESKTVHVPKTQVFSPTGLKVIMEKASKGELP